VTASTSHQPAVSRLLIAILLLLGLTGHAACITQPIMQGQDPQIAFKDGFFNLPQSDGCNIRLTRAASLAGLATAGNTLIYAAGCSNVWAPEIHWSSSSNCWFIYYSVDTGDSGVERVHVIQSTGVSPLGPYTDRGVLLPGYWNIDGSVFTATSGQLYFIFSGSPSGTQSIYIAPMSNPYTLSGAPVMISAPTQVWERNGAVNEGPYGFVRNGRTFIVYSASGCWTDDYCLGLLTLTGTNPLDPAAWTKSGPVFSKQPTAYGPGHNCVFQDGFGQWWNVYHANNLTGQGCGGYRQLRMQRIFWDTGDSPYFGTPVPINSLVVEGTNYLVAQYPLTAGSGAAAATTTCGPSGLLVGSPAWQNPGLKFNGINDYVDCGAALGNDVQSTLTLAAWIRPDAFADWAGIITKGTNASPFAMQTWSDGSLRFSANWGAPSGGIGAGSWNSNAKMLSNQWYHVAVTYDGTTIRFYTNGVLDTYQAAVALHFGVVNESMTLGADFPGGDEYFKGTILDARVYGRALAASEINALINHPPVFTPVANQNTSAGVTLLVTNRATDLEVPPQILAFNLRNGPAGADVNPMTGVFSWRPRTSQADSTNAITVTVSDNGLPSLMATQTFFVTVGKSAPPTVSAPSLSNGFFQMSINGDLGPDYQIWTSTNLMNWQSLLQSNSPLLPFVWSDPNTTNYSSRFYRIMLSP
jgi:GH43 family beta-xylosidase